MQRRMDRLSFPYSLFISCESIIFPFNNHLLILKFNFLVILKSEKSFKNNSGYFLMKPLVGKFCFFFLIMRAQYWPFHSYFIIILKFCITDEQYTLLFFLSFRIIMLLVSTIDDFLTLYVYNNIVVKDIFKSFGLWDEFNWNLNGVI